MRKEVMYAIIAGILFGLVVAFGVWRANATMNGNDITSAQTSPTETPKTTNPSQLNISLAKPDSFSVVNENSIGISGLTAPDTWVVVSGESIDYVIKSKQDGTFEQTVDLVPGINNILTTSLNLQGETSTASTLIIYSSEFKIPTDDENDSSTQDSEGATGSSIRQKIQEKVDSVLKSPKAYLGVITDISDGTIQINKFNPNQKDQVGKEIKQVSVPTNTVYIKSQKGEVKSIKYTDVAIGDFIAAMGFVNGNSVLEAQRVLVTDQPESTIRLAKLGTIKSVSKTKFTITTPFDNSDTEVVEEADTKITKDQDGKTLKGSSSDLNTGVVLIVSGKPDIKNFFARRIHIISTPVVATATPKAKAK
jgi:hypothetical protein